MAADEEHHQTVFLKRLLTPQPIASLYAPFPSTEISCLFYESATDPPKPHTLKGIFPFMTAYDIKLAIYDAMNQEDIALPEYTFVGIPNFLGKKLTPLDYSWKGGDKGMALSFPLEAIQKGVHDERFVESSGARRILGIQERSRMTLESMFPGKTYPTLHVFFYKVLDAAVPGEHPIGEYDWNGYLYAYFPTLSVEQHIPTNDEATRCQAFIRRRQFYQKLQGVLADPLVPLTLTGIRFLRINYLKPKAIPGIEAVFYNATVSAIRPYMRLLPAEGTPISKLHMIGDKPDIEDPRLLLQWAQERNLTPDRDSSFVKILLRKKSGSISPLYATLRLLDDGTADITIEPPKGVRKLDPRSELESLPDTIQSALAGFPYLNETPSLKNGMMSFALQLKDGVPSLSQRSLRQKLPIFSSIFQEIPALPGETPILMLRYKLINNFVSEDRIQSFITQIMSRKLILGDTNYTDIVDLVAEDFDIPVEEARKQVAIKLKGAADIRPTLLEEGDPFVPHANPGIDIAIFAQHPFYSFHLYRVDSQEAMERIITFLSILFSVSAEKLTVSKEAVVEITQKEEDEFEDVPEPVEAEPEKAADSEFYEDLMFDVEEGATLEEEFGPSAVEARPEAPLSDDDFTDVPAPSAEGLRKQIAQDVEPKKFTFAKAETTAETASKGFEKYFSDKLKEADRKLFDYHKTHPSLKKYVTDCASNLGRQPAVMSEAQFNQMVKEYEDVLKSKEIAFFVFPLSKDAKKEPYNPKTTEYYTLLRYGTNPKDQHYYLCCRYFCTRDEIMVREKEYHGTVLRRPVRLPDGTERTTKEADTCPFCEGKLIRNRRFPGVNETIIERIVKGGTADSRHLYIRFLKKTSHPDGFYLPCCFLEDQPIRIGDPPFPEGKSTRAPVPLLEVEEEEEIESTTTVAGTLQSVSYEEVMYSAPHAYIVGSEKLPLQGIVKHYKKIRQGGKDVRGPPTLSEPQIGLLPPQLNSFFLQDPVDLVSRTFNPQKLKAGAQGFLRIGVENNSRYTNDSFLAAVAPFFGLNSSAGLKKLIGDIVQPRLFSSLNYGNLLLEMYKPNTERPTINDEFKEWAKKMLRIRKLTTGNEELAVRSYMSYNNFMKWLESDATRKEYRHFANLFIQPGILDINVGKIAETGAAVEIHRPGILFVVLDLLKSGEVKVRCPPYPLNHELATKSDIGFLFHHYSGIWEPIFYVDNRAPAERTFNSYSLAFSNSHLSKWPKIIQDRVQEFLTQCRSTTGSKGYYTSFLGVSSKKCVGISALKGQLAAYTAISYYGIVRDSYNHVAAAVYKNESGGLVAIPTVDDGLSIDDGVLILDWDDFTPAPIDQVVAFYTKYIYPRYAEQYTIVAQVKSAGSGRLEAVQLKNGLYVPVSAGQSDLSENTISEMEWSINRKITMGNSEEEPPGDELRIQTKEFNEVYEHLRLTFSNWLHAQEEGGEMRTLLETTMYRTDIPLFEKRKRMEIILASTVESWISESDEDKEGSSLLRVDCTLRSESECSGSCSWVQDKGCLIHSPTKAPNTTMVPAAHVLLLRLIEELLRFGNRRKQLFDQKVSQLSTLDVAVRKGDEYIIPEKSAVWTEILRLEWSQEHADAPVYLEEMSTLYPTNPVAQEASNLPEELKELLGDTTLHLYPSSTKTLFPFLAALHTSPSDVGLTDESSSLTEPSLNALLRKTAMPIVQIDLRTTPATVLVKQPQRDRQLGYPVFVLRDDYPVSLLVRNPEEPDFLQADQLPVALQTMIKAAPKLFIKVSM
jgi:hypothetical protein